MSHTASIRRDGLVIGAVRWAFIGIACLLILVPSFYMVSNSLRSRAEYAADPLGLPLAPTIDNYVKAWERGALAPAFVNTTVITIGSIIGLVVVGSLAAYAIVRWRGRSGNRIYLYFVMGLIIPFQIGIPVLYRVWAQLGLIDSLFGIVLLHIGSSLPLTIFLFAGFLLSVPLELEESARVDGASEFRVFWQIVFPLLRPVTATVVILNGLGIWNDLILSLFFLQSEETFTLTRATVLFQAEDNIDQPALFAFGVMTVLPVVLLFVIFQRYFMSGLTQGALRG